MNWEKVRQMKVVQSYSNPTRPIPNGNVTAKATDNRDHTTDASAPKQATVPAPEALTIQQPHHGSTKRNYYSRKAEQILSLQLFKGKKLKLKKKVLDVTRR